MKSMKFYIYASNIAIMLFGFIFVFIGFTNVNYILLVLGAALALYGLARLYRMLKAVKQQDVNDDL